jgi:hypothetical protein
MLSYDRQVREADQAKNLLMKDKSLNILMLLPPRRHVQVSKKWNAAGAG